MPQDPALSEIAARALASCEADSVGLYTFDDSGSFEDGVILGMPDAFIRAYETTGITIDPILAEMRRRQRPVSTETVLGARWTRSQLYRRVSGRFGLTGFATLPLYRGRALSGVLYLGHRAADAPCRLSGDSLCGMSVLATQVSTELMARPRRHPRLTPRQDAVARLATEGLTNRQIAEALGTGEAAVAKHMKALRALFDVRTRTALARAYLADF